MAIHTHCVHGHLQDPLIYNYKCNNTKTPIAPVDRAWPMFTDYFRKKHSVCLGSINSLTLCSHCSQDKSDFNSQEVIGGHCAWKSELYDDFRNSWLLLFSRREFLISSILTKSTKRACFSRISSTNLELTKLKTRTVKKQNPSNRSGQTFKNLRKISVLEAFFRIR